MCFCAWKGQKQSKPKLLRATSYELNLIQETFRSCADIAITGKEAASKAGLKKMEKLKKLYLLLKKREKVKLVTNERERALWKKDFSTNFRKEPFGPTAFNTSSHSMIS